ncbi:MAG: TldD/PmbA family protein [Defluviitaleaceae bacterium]|nr:TldD/PmbA family protein [Defluviitaleaceae bacterium]
MLNKEAARSILDKTMAQVGHYATAVLSATEQNTTRFANSEISQNVAITDMNLSLTVYDGKKSATCSTNVVTDDGLKELAKDAENLLKYVPEGEFEAFPFSDEPVQESSSDGSLLKAFGVAERAKFVKDGVAFIEPGYTAAGALNFNRNVLAVGDSKKGFRYSAYDYVNFNTVVTHEDGTAGGRECCSYTAPPDILGCFKNAQATAKAARNAVSPELGARTVVLSPLAFADLMGFVCYMLDAKEVEDGASFAMGKLGQKVFGENLTVRDDANHPGLRPLPFDTEGNPRRTLTLIDKGVVASYLYDNATAARQNVKSTGHASIWGQGGFPANIVIDGGGQSMEEIIASTEKGIYINEFHYTNFVNARSLQITGLTRNGAFLIENGKLTTPMATVRFTESMLDALRNITAVSNHRELIGTWGGAALVPGVRIENFHFTSKP